MDDFAIRECSTVEELDACVKLQRDVFGLPDLEISPRRHLIVSRQAGGWTLGAFTLSDHRLIGFVHHLVAVRDGIEIAGYSHMMAVARDYQNFGVGGKLKWAQRERALSEGRSFIKWTWEPMQARNAHFNLNRLGVIVREYAENFYGTDYATSPELRTAGAIGIDSDRLFANWHLKARRVRHLSTGSPEGLSAPVAQLIEMPANWNDLQKTAPADARREQLRVRTEFRKAFAAGLVCAGFQRGDRPSYQLFSPDTLTELFADQ